MPTVVVQQLGRQRLRRSDAVVGDVQLSGLGLGVCEGQSGCRAIGKIGWALEREN